MIRWDLHRFAPKLARSSFLFYLCALVLAGSLLLGGGTREGFLSDGILQLLALPLLLTALWNTLEVRLSRQAVWALLLCLAIALVPLIQLIPLPPGLWTRLPNRGPMAEAIALAGRDLPWMPISVSPQATWLALLSLIPAAAIFATTLLLSYRERRQLTLVILAIGVASVFLGLIQLAQGETSPLRFFEVTNVTEAVGFFANRNHFSALMYSLLLLAAAWAAYTVAEGRGDNRTLLETAWIVPVVAAFIVLVVLVAAQAMARSRAGLGLTMVALVGAFALAASHRWRGETSGVTPRRLIMGATAVGFLFAMQFALYRVLDRFDVDPMADYRIPFARNTIEAAKAYMPLGSGLGTFVSVYGMFEKPADAMPNTYANRAHNDVLEVWLETGILGIALAALFLFWLALRTLEVWRRAPAWGRDIDLLLVRAATVIIALLIAHSFVDYPLRTGAMMGIMAFACALLIRPPVAVESRERVRLQEMAELSPRQHRTRQAAPAKATGVLPVSAVAPPSDLARAMGQPVRPPPEFRAAELEWPEAWRQPAPRLSSGSEHVPRAVGSPHRK